MFQCQSITKKMEQCKVKVSGNSELYNNKRICHLHLKTILKNNEKVLASTIIQDTSS